MKRLVLIKQFYSTDVAHLYEHLFCIAASNFFIENGAYQYVDYSLVGKTNHPGIISIDLELYSKNAISIVGRLQSLKLPLKKSDIINGITQIFAEEEKPLFVTDYNALKKELGIINDSEWSTLDDFSLLDAKAIIEAGGSLYVAVGDPQPARILSVALRMEREFTDKHRELLPLFYEFSRIIIDNLHITLPARFGYYSFNDEYKQTLDSVERVNHFKIAHDESIELNMPETLEFIHDSVDEMMTARLFERYAAIFQDITFFENPNHMPNFERIYEDTKILIGREGWKHIATAENVQLVLKNIHLTLICGSETAHAPLSRMN